MRYYLFLLSFLFYLSLAAQDPAYTSFHNNRLLFNPSLVGTTGAQSWKARMKSQWLRDGGQGYKTVGLMVEETMPCTILDGGFKIVANEEGQGRYRTVEVGGLLAATLPNLGNQFHDLNVRFGTDIGFGYNSIDYSRLTWSDQLDPKYGAINKTAFSAPNGGYSAWFFNPGFGVSARALLNKKSRKAIMLNSGVGLYRFWAISDKLTNQSVSVLGLKEPNNLRMTFFVESEFVPIYFDRNFVTVRPAIFYQKQGKLDYTEFGARFGYTRRAGVSAYYHLAAGNEFGQTKWITVGSDFMVRMGNGKIVELNFNWSENIGGLQNFSGSQFEVGITYHLAKSTICRVLDMEDDVPYGDEYRCPIMALTPGKRKMYENIWYKN